MAFEPEITVFRTDRSGIRKVLGDLEAEVMELIWEHPMDQGVLVRHIFDILYDRRHKQIAYTTVMSTMARLAKKRVLRVEKKDHAYVYYPTQSQDEFITLFASRILEDLLVNFSGVTLQNLQTLTDAQATTRAYELLNEIARRRVMEEEQ